jgi:hypothetical protein
MFSIVYVLVSTGQDVYYKQLIISLRTLRYRMKDIPVIVLVDENTFAALTEIPDAEIFQLAHVKSVNVSDQYSAKEKSRYLKTSLRNILDGDLLFIDCDTAICADFSDYYNEAPLALVDDGNIAWKKVVNKKPVINLNMQMKFNPSDYKEYFNSGVMWIRDLPETRKFFEYWYEYWKSELKFGDCLDQPALNYVNEKIMPLISKLPVIWNCQVSSNPSGVQYLADAYIIHYFNFNDGPYLLASRDFVMENFNSSLMAKIIENPKSAFIDSYISPYNNLWGTFLATRTFRSGFYLYRNYRFCWQILENMLKVPEVLKHLLQHKK